MLKQRGNRLNQEGRGFAPDPDQGALPLDPAKGRGPLGPINWVGSLRWADHDLARSVLALPREPTKLTDFKGPRPLTVVQEDRAAKSGPMPPGGFEGRALALRFKPLPRLKQARGFRE
jgi:hypothetical protein